MKVQATAGSAVPLSVGESRKRLVLASGSPRRRELVSAFAAPFEISPPVGAEPRVRADETPEEYVIRLALQKARGVAERTGPAIVVGADTVVVLGHEVMGKPSDAAEARRMLGLLRERSHRVVSGVVALDSATARWSSATESTQVKFRRYTDEELADYIESGEPFDKAGGYAVQDPAFRPAASIEGCYLNVVGLPLCEAQRLLALRGADGAIRHGWRPPDECVGCRLQLGNGQAGR